MPGNNNGGGRTPLSVNVLQHVLEANGWTQDDLATKAGLHRSTVSMQFAGQRAIRDEHLSSYLRPLDRHHRQILMAAWLRDTLGADVLTEIVDPAVNRVREPIIEWAPALSAADQKMLSWLADEMANDPELAVMFRSMCKRLGYEC